VLSRNCRTPRDCSLLRCLFEHRRCFAGHALPRHNLQLQRPKMPVLVCECGPSVARKAEYILFVRFQSSSISRRSTRLPQKWLQSPLSKPLRSSRELETANDTRPYEIQRIGSKKANRLQCKFASGSPAMYLSLTHPTFKLQQQSRVTTHFHELEFSPIRRPN
jgi:hypothetical protein